MKNIILFVILLCSFNVYSQFGQRGIITRYGTYINENNVHSDLEWCNLELYGTLTYDNDLFTIKYEGEAYYYHVVRFENIINKKTGEVGVDITLRNRKGEGYLGYLTTLENGTQLLYIVERTEKRELVTIFQIE